MLIRFRSRQKNQVQTRARYSAIYQIGKEKRDITDFECGSTKIMANEANISDVPIMHSHHPARIPRRE
jgi:hypothetical protein